MIKKWFPIQKFVEWVQGEKHPSTPITIFKNLYNQDRIRKILVARCNICSFVVSRDPIAVKELLYKCEDKRCCVPLSGPALHQVCDPCYWMWRALYLNLGLKDNRYFYKIDEKEKEASDNQKRRW